MGTLTPFAEELCGDDDAVLQATSLYRFFRTGETEVVALQGVSLSVTAGEMVTVSGPSGAGKSTLLSCLAGMDNPDGGVVRIRGQRVSHQPELVQARLRAAYVGLVFQGANLFTHLTVAQNISLVRRLRGRSGRSAVSLLDSLGIEHRARAYPEQLSGGELVRAGLAVAMANDPPVILADEPTGELDAATEHAVLEQLKDRTRQGAAILVASHSPAVAAAADRCLTLSDGRLR